ncbi:MAG: hypothetical protein ACYTXF_37205 [Nostoc sp.]
MMCSRYENLLQTAIWWAVVGGQELPLCNGHGHPEVLSPEGKEIQIPSGTVIYERNVMYLLKLSQKQLEFLVFVDGQDDWHPAGFLEVVIKNYENKKDGTLTELEFESMMQQLGKLSRGQISSFQVALNTIGLGLL